MLEVARRGAELDHVLVIPAARPPHKRGSKVSAAHDRVAMLRLAFAEADDVLLYEGELERPGPSYSIDTVRELRRLCGADGPAFFWILGSDNLAGLGAWKEAGALLAEAAPLVVARPGAELAVPSGFDPELAERLAAGFLESAAHPATATEVRAELAAGVRPSHVSRAVWEYARSRGLYGGA